MKIGVNSDMEERKKNMNIPLNCFFEKYLEVVGTITLWNETKLKISIIMNEVTWLSNRSNLYLTFYAALN